VSPELGGWHLQRDRRVHEARAVEMKTEVERAALLRDGRDLGERPDPPARAVVRVLDRDDPRARRVVVLPRPRELADQLRPEATVRRRDRPSDQAGEHRRPAELGDQHVRVLLGEQLVARPSVQPERDLVRHRGRRQEDRLLLPEQLCAAGLELVHGRVLAFLLVSDDGVRDRPAHSGGRLRQRVGAKLDHAMESASVP
jgi:hypothetical protein